MQVIGCLQLDLVIAQYDTRYPDRAVLCLGTCHPDAVLWRHTSPKDKCF